MKSSSKSFKSSATSKIWSKIISASSIFPKPFWPPLLYTVVGVLIYWKSFGASFRFDDYIFIVDRIQSHHLSRVWVEGDLFRKIPYLTFALNYLWSGKEVWSWHVVNLFLHILTSLCVYGLSCVFLRSEVMKKYEVSSFAKPIAIFSGLIFLCHPLMTSAVTYIYQRMIVMATLFHVLTLYTYAKARIDGQKKFWLLAVVSGSLACFTKQINVSLPFTILLVEMFFCSSSTKQFFKRGLMFGFFALIPAAFYIKIIRLDLSHFNLAKLKSLYPTNVNSGLTWSQWFPTEINAIRTYLRLFIFPIHQTMDYDYPISQSFFEPSVLLSIAILATLATTAIFLYRSHRLISFGIIFIGLTFLPDFFAIRDVIFEHRAYLPFVGFALLLPVAIHSLVNQPRKVVGILMTLVIAMSVATVSRNRLWANEEQFWKEDILRSPNKGRPYYSLGVYYAFKGRHDLAIPQYRRALELWPLYADCWTNLGKSLEEIGQTKESINAYARAVELDPTMPEALNNYGSALVRMGKYEDARKLYLEAIRRREDHFEAMNNIGSSYAREKKFDEAMKWYQRSLKIKPDYADSHNNVGSILGMRGQYEEAEKSYLKAISLRPDYFDAYFNLATMYVWKGDLQNAKKMYQKCLEFQQFNVEINNNLGSILAGEGDYKKAEQLYLNVLKVDPRHADALKNLANVYEKTNRIKEAKYCLSLLENLNPKATKVQNLQTKTLP